MASAIVGHRFSVFFAQTSFKDEDKLLTRDISSERRLKTLLYYIFIKEAVQTVQNTCEFDSKVLNTFTLSLSKIETLNADVTLTASNVSNIFCPIA